MHARDYDQVAKFVGPADANAGMSMGQRCADGHAGAVAVLRAFVQGHVCAHHLVTARDHRFVWSTVVVCVTISRVIGTAECPKQRSYG